MFGLLHLADGTAEYVPNADRFQSLIHERLGRDAADIVAELIRQADAEFQRAETDLLAYETENEELVHAMRSASISVEKLRKEIAQSTRINRAEIVKKLAEIERALAVVI